jgi:hypothetical protein
MQVGFVVRLAEGPSFPLYTHREKKQLKELADAIARQLTKPE